MRTLLFVAAGLGLAFSITPAHAQTGTPKGNEYFEKKDKDGSSVIFGDDPMTAPGLDPGGATLTVRGRAMRTLLIRPRLQFLQELAKSVENL